VSEASRPPDFISLGEHRDHDHPAERWIRWIFVGLLVSLAVAGLANVFGQRPSTAAAETRDATLRLRAPHAIRGGLLFQGRFEVVARRALGKPTVVLDAGWFDNLTINTIVPEPVRSTSVGQGIALEYGRLPAGRTLTVYFQFQVEPTTVGRRSQDVVLRDGSRQIVEIRRAVTVFP
jgi:hypothetical protein